MNEDASLLTSFEGRIGRGRYWSGWAYVILFSILCGIVSLAAIELLGGRLSVRAEFPYRLLFFLMKTALLFPLAAIMVKRLHDRNKSGYHAAFALGLLWLHYLTDFIGITAGRTDILEFVYLTVILAVFFWYLFELGFLRGTPGPNAYGPDPLIEAARS